MKAKNFILIIVLVFSSVITLPYMSDRAFAQEQDPPARPQPINTDTTVLSDTPLISQSTIGALSLTWSTCGYCPQASETSFSANTVRLGVANRSEYSYQSKAVHGASTLLPPASKYTVTFDYILYTWDSYQPSAVYKGYWDSFSVSVSGKPYWQLSLSDPVTSSSLPGLFITGGSIWGDGILQPFSGSKTIILKGNPAGSNYLNVILDTATLPSADNAYPSWGSITIKNIVPDTELSGIASQAADLAKQVVGGPYGWGGKGWDWTNKLYVDPQVIKNGSNYSYYVAASKQIESRKGLDCAGLIYWAYDRASGSTEYYGNPVYYEGAHQQCSNLQSDPVTSDLRPGDILCFNYGSRPGLQYDHVAMYVGGGDPSKDVVEASTGIKFSSKSELESTSAFKGYRRIKPANVPLKIQSHSPINLVVTDPDGFSVDSNTLITSDEEYIRGIPDVLYYSTDSNLDDLVYAPTLKTGLYTIQVVPKAGVLPTDRFSLEVTGNGQFVVLAQNVFIKDIPSEPFGVIWDGDEIIPTQSTLLSYVPINVRIADTQKEIIIFR